MRFGPTIWWVLNKEAVTNTPCLDESQKITNDKVSIVTIDCEMFMSCNCGRVRMFLMTYAYVCTLIGKIEYYVLQTKYCNKLGPISRLCCELDAKKLFQS